VCVSVCQISYIIFLVVYIYTVLVRSLPMPEWNEWYVVIYMVGLALEKLREVIYAGRLNVGFVSSF